MSEPTAVPQLVDKVGLAEAIPTLKLRRINNLVALKAIPHYKIQNRIMFDLREIREWIASHRVEVAQ